MAIFQKSKIKGLKFNVEFKYMLNKNLVVENKNERSSRPLKSFN